MRTFPQRMLHAALVCTAGHRTEYRSSASETETAVVNGTGEKDRRERGREKRKGNDARERERKESTRYARSVVALSSYG